MSVGIVVVEPIDAVGTVERDVALSRGLLALVRSSYALVPLALRRVSVVSLNMHKLTLVVLLLAPSLAAQHVVPR